MALSIKTLRLFLESDLLSQFREVLQKGFTVTVPIGQTVADLLSGHFGIPADYVRGRISTIFLDGRAIDAISSVRVREGSTIALSSAMPGLAGAALRREGPLSAMRSGITHQGGGTSASSHEGLMRIKLFNAVMAEAGRLFLEKGILLEPEEARQFFGSRPAVFSEGCREVLLDGLLFDSRRLGEATWTEGCDWVECICIFE